MSRWASRRVGQSRGFRRGAVFPVRLIDQEREALERARDESAGPQGLGPFLVWAALRAFAGGVLPARERSTGYYPAAVVPGQAEQSRYYPSSSQVRVIPEQVAAEVLPAPGSRMILDLCAGSGSWSRPYKVAGYQVVEVTLPHSDVRSFAPPRDVWGVLAAPPCDQFSLARNGHDSERDFLGALEVVVACMRVVALSGCRWWALENPVGLLGRWLGTPRDVWEPYEFGDAWTKRTAIWGNFVIPDRGPFVEPLGSAMERSTAALRAVTPPGFAEAFFRANP